jgi:tRNA (guanine-N7-)-methyltransferase
MFESKNKYFGRKKGKSFVRLEQYSKFLKEPNKRLFNKIKTPRILEIGIGDGEKISEDAKLYSKINFIGCDIFADGVLRAIRNSVNDNLKNLQVFHLNIQDLLPFIPNNYLQEIRIYFPDPWPKNKHKKRRTVNQLLVKDLTKKLKKNGFVRFATDHGDYFIK